MLLWFIYLFEPLLHYKLNSYMTWLTDMNFLFHKPICFPGGFGLNGKYELCINIFSTKTNLSLKTNEMYNLFLSHF